MIVVTYRQTNIPVYPFENEPIKWIVRYPSKVEVLWDSLWEVDQIHHRTSLICDLNLLVSIEESKNET